MRLRYMPAAVLAGLALALAVPAAGHAADDVPQLDFDGSQSGAVTIPGTTW